MDSQYQFRRFSLDIDCGCRCPYPARCSYTPDTDAHHTDFNRCLGLTLLFVARV
jgi:hypothetical protein